MSRLIWISKTISRLDSRKNNSCSRFASTRINTLIQLTLKAFKFDVIAERVNLTRARVTQMVRHKVIAGEKFGRDWMIDEDQFPVIENLPENRGKNRWKSRTENNN